MNSKEALNKLFMACDNDLLYEQSGIMFATKLTSIIKQDLDRLEKLEKVIEILKKFSNEYYFDGNYLISDNGESIKIDYSQYNLLKEVLGNEV